MATDPQKSDKPQSTVIITDRFIERRAMHAVRGSDEANAEPLEVGSMVGRYLTLSRIGVGGMGVVYRAHDTELNRTVALKVLPPHLGQNPEYLKRFRTEARAQARLNNPHVITLYELMEHPVGQVLVLEYVEGETLESRLRHYGPLSLEEASRIFEQALNGLQHIHQMGVVHRDLKPSNIFITRDGTVKLMDFGIARLTDNHDPAQHGAMVGTLLYISPEQINGRETDCRSDIYTLGISLFESIAGRLPFERRSDYALMHAHVQENPPSPKEFQRRLPPKLEAVILKAIEKEPNRRFQSAVEFRLALMELGLVERRHIAAESFSGVRRPQRRDSRRIWGGKWFDLSLVATAVLLVVALDLYPLPKVGVEDTSVSVAPAQKIARQKTIEHKRAAQNDESDSSVPPATQDKYQSVRQAWSE
ncbi:MAG: serine/threonine protein kinase [Gammaproteobacteria bacterium]|nr:serine/threonine protein kinase [Gammaproteobacteria bacterium]